MRHITFSICHLMCSTYVVEALLPKDLQELWLTCHSQGKAKRNHNDICVRIYVMSCQNALSHESVSLLHCNKKATIYSSLTCDAHQMSYKCAPPMLPVAVIRAAAEAAHQMVQLRRTATNLNRCQRGNWVMAHARRRK
jgi:hypothetical protein